MEIPKIIKPDKRWYEIILWWEIRRIPYNIIMYFIGLASFYISYVSIPLVYVVIGLLLNIGYAFCWMIELVISRGKFNGALKSKYPVTTFLLYLLLSTVTVFGVAFFFYSYAQ